MERLDGHAAAVKPDGWPWTDNERGGNHRVVSVPGPVSDYLWMLEQPIENDRAIGRRKYRISASLVTRLKAESQRRLVAETKANVEITRPPRVSRARSN